MATSDNVFGPYTKWVTFSVAYVHAGVYEIGLLWNNDGGFGFHEDTGQLSLHVRYNL
jgi:hypothetical protein